MKIIHHRLRVKSYSSAAVLDVNENKDLKSYKKIKLNDFQISILFSSELKTSFIFIVNYAFLVLKTDNLNSSNPLSSSPKIINRIFTFHSTTNR